jgi:L-threonylcarbamoyladenylate synthase
MNVMCKTERLIANRQSGSSGVERAAEILRAGGTVAFPTETVYGLGASAFDQEAVAKIFAAKQRPGWDPLIVHVRGEAMLEQVVAVPIDAQERVSRLNGAFWPGPLTLLLPRTSAIPESVTAGRSLVGVRMPANPVALRLIELVGVPIAAPSANRFGHTSPTTAAHVLADLDGRIDAVLDGGSTAVGIESTVLDVTQNPMVIYRPGVVTASMIVKATGCEVRLFRAVVDGGKPPESLPSPGVGMRHYAPRARLVLVEIPALGTVECTLHEAIERLEKSDEMVGVMLPTGWDASYAEESFAWGDWGDEAMLAQRLFAGLRALDARGVGVIVCPIPVGGGIGVALRDRLEKAARPE